MNEEPILKSLVKIYDLSLKVTEDKDAIVVNKLHILVIDQARKGVEFASKIGEILKKKKQEVAGTFYEWVELNCDFSARTATRYMKVHSLMSEGVQIKTMHEADSPKLRIAPQQRIRRIKYNDKNLTSKELEIDFNKLKLKLWQELEIANELGRKGKFLSFEQKKKSFNMIKGLI